MAKDYNSAKSNTSTSVKSEGGGGKALEEFSASPGGDHHSTRSNTTSVNSDSGGGKTIDEFSASPGGDYNSTRSNTTSIEVGGGGKEPIREAAGDYHSTRSNTTSIKSGGGGGSTTGLKSTLAMMKTGFTLATVIVVVAAGTDVYKMYSDHVNINLEDHITDANFHLTEDKDSIVGDIGFDIPKMGYFEKSTKFEIHLKILESDPVTEDDFTFTYVLGSGEKIYDEFELNNLDPVTKDKIDKEEPLRIEYTVTMTVIYLGVELGPTTSVLGTKVTTMQTA